MLSETERQEIETELRHYEDKRAVCIDALKIVQQHRGWVSDESLQDIGEVLDMTPAELDSVATFFNLIFRRPVGKHVILICDSVSCWIMGYESICAHLKTRLGIDLGQTTQDGQFTLLTVPCLGACDRAPAMLLDNELYTELTPEKIDDILDKTARGTRF